MVFLSGWEASGLTVIFLYSILFYTDMLAKAFAIETFSPGTITWIFGLNE